MTAARLAIAVTAIGLVLSLWLLVSVTWYTFGAFMVVAQPLLVLGLLIFVVAAVKGLRRRGVL